MVKKIIEKHSTYTFGCLIPLLLIIFLAICLIFAGCSGDHISNLKAEDGTWFIVKSPITGRYYEVFSINYPVGMSEVTEREYQKYLELIGR